VVIFLKHKLLKRKIALKMRKCSALLVITLLTDKPHNPMINAGAIVVCSLIERERPLEERTQYVSVHLVVCVAYKSPCNATTGDEADYGDM